MEEKSTVAHTQSGEILQWSEAAELLYGWTAEEALGQDIFKLLATGLPEPLEDILALIEAGSEWSGLLIQQSKSGTDMCVRASWQIEDGLMIQKSSPAKSTGDSLSLGPLAECLLNTYPGSVFLFDIRDRRTIFLHGQQLAALGYTHEEINSMGTLLTPTLLHPEDLATFGGRLDEYAEMAKGETLEHVHRLRAKDGTYRSISTTGSVFAWNADGNPSHIVGYAVDVTDDLEAERTIRLLQEQLKFALSSTGMIAWIWDYASDTVLRVGDVQSIFGNIDPNAEAFAKAVHPDDWHLSDEAIERAKNGSQMDGVQMRIIRKDGQVRWIEERGAVLKDPQGNPTHMVGVTIDVTEQRRKEEVSRRTHRSLRLALQAARASTWQWDCLTNLIVVSDDAFELFGLPRGAPPTMQDWLARIHPEDRDAFWAEAQGTSRDGMDLFIDFRVVMPDGVTKPVRAVAQRATDDNGNATEVIGIVMDLSIFRGIIREEEQELESWAA